MKKNSKIVLILSLIFCISSISIITIMYFNPKGKSCNFSICTANQAQFIETVSVNEQGTAVCIWNDGRNEEGLDIYAQRINSSCKILWNFNGKSICNASSDQDSIRICSDNLGSAIIVWADNRNTDCDIYGQYINENGTILWELNGKPISKVSECQNQPVMTNDISGNIYICWHDERNSYTSSSDIYGCVIKVN